MSHTHRIGGEWETSFVPESSQMYPWIVFKWVRQGEGVNVPYVAGCFASLDVARRFVATRSGAVTVATVTAEAALLLKKASEGAGLEWSWAGYNRPDLR